VKVFNQNGGVIPNASVTVTSDNVNVAKVRAGLSAGEWTLQAMDQGTCKVTARSGNVSKTINVTVVDVPKAIVLNPQNRNLSYSNGESVTITAKAEYNDGTSRDVTAKCTWSVRVGSAGQPVAGATNVISATDFNPGDTLTVTATYNGVTGTTKVYIK
jgi:hypothetical protein